VLWEGIVRGQTRKWYTQEDLRCEGEKGPKGLYLAHVAYFWPLLILFDDPSSAFIGLVWWPKPILSELLLNAGSVQTEKL
jgi:hypothetical protein